MNVTFSTMLVPPLPTAMAMTVFNARDLVVVVTGSVEGVLMPVSA